MQITQVIHFNEHNKVVEQFYTSKEVTLQSEFARAYPGLAALGWTVDNGGLRVIWGRIALIPVNVD